MTQLPWYRTAFERQYRDVYAHRDLAAARFEASALVALGCAGRCLDLCCGFGRHTLALCELGLDAYGLDLSADLLAAASELPAASLLAGRLLQGDARALPFRSGSMQSVCVLFQSFGYFDERDNQHMLAEIARVLARGGLLVLDLMNAERVRAGLVAESQRELGSAILMERRHLSQQGRRVVKELRLQLNGQPDRAWREDVRLYELEEMRALGAAVGLELRNPCGSFRREPFEAGSERMLLCFERWGR